MGILIVNVGARDGGVVILEVNVVAKLGFFPPELCRDRLALCNLYNDIKLDGGIRQKRSAS